MKIEPENIYVQKHAIKLLVSSQEPDKVSRGWHILDRALSSNPQDVDLRLYEARRLMTRGTAPAIEKAQEVLLEITQEYPKVADSWVLLSQIHFQHAQFRKAMDTILSGLAYSPVDTNLLLLKTRVEVIRAPESAIPTLKQLCEREPDNSRILFELARIYISIDQPDKAETLLKNFLANCKGQECRNADMILAVALYKNNNKIEAKRKFNLLYEGNADDSKVFLAEAKMLVDGHEWDQLWHRINDWLQQNPDDISTFIVLARKLIATKNDIALDITEKLLRKILERNVECIEAMSLLAMILQVNNRPVEAAKLYEKIIEIQPDTYVAINNLAWIMCEEQGKYQQALELVQKGLRKVPDYIDLVDTRGVIYYRLGEHKKAVRDFTRCVNLYPKNSSSLVSSHFHLARVLVALGQDNNAIQNLRKTLDLSKEIGGLSSDELAEVQRLLVKLTGVKKYGAVTN